MTPARAAFITLEGIDGAGKTTHLGAITAWIERLGKPLLRTREPGGTPLGERLRELVLRHEMRPDTEALLMFAARSEHVQTVILPALAAGHWVLSDRFSDASVAYQGGGRELGVARVEALETWTHPGLRPDLTLLFDLDPALAAGRLDQGRQDRDRFELEQLGFFERVRSAYLARAQAEPDRFCVLDAARPQDDVWRQIEAALQSLAARA
jgi:dTMP kinase